MRRFIDIIGPLIIGVPQTGRYSIRDLAGLEYLCGSGHTNHKPMVVPMVRNRTASIGCEGQTTRARPDNHAPVPMALAIRVTFNVFTKSVSYPLFSVVALEQGNRIAASFSHRKDSLYSKLHQYRILAKLEKHQSCELPPCHQANVGATASARAIAGTH